MVSRDAKMRTWGGEPRANLSVFALLLAWVIVSWFPGIALEFVVTVSMLGSPGGEGIGCQRAGILERGALEHSFHEHIPHSLGVPARSDF